MDHPYRRYRLAIVNDALEVSDEGLVVQTVDAIGAIVPTSNGHLLVAQDLITLSTDLYPLADGLVAGTAQNVALGRSYGPAVESAGVRAIFGVEITGNAVGIPLSPDGALAGPPVTVIPSNEVFYQSMFDRLATGFVASWTSNADTCRFARLDDNLATLGTPTTIDLPGECRFARAAALDSDRLVLAAFDTVSYATYVRVTDLAFNVQFNVPSFSGGYPAVLADGDRVWLSWATSLGGMEHAWIGRDGVLQPLGALGTIGITYGHWLVTIDGQPVLIWQDGGGTIAAARLCR